ncbi:MAG: hypothetical protein WDZ30_12925 [Cellvibrionaceae bacterium]
MKINDDVLSAFLDAELSDAEMKTVREKLAEDQTLSDRLAELSAVDDQVAARYAEIDARPLPESVSAMLASEEAHSAKVIAFPLWRRAQRGLQEQLQQHAGMAAALALAIGLGAGQLFPSAGSGGNNEWSAVAQGLENTPSGVTAALDNGNQLTPRLSFVNQQGLYCRQFQLRESSRASENIACRAAENGDSGSWQLAASIQLAAIQRPGNYQTASGGSRLDSALDEMMDGEAFDANAEKALIAEHWVNR